MRPRLFLPIPLLNEKACIVDVDNIDYATDKFDHKSAEIKTLFMLKTGKPVYSIMTLQAYFNGLFGNNQQQQPQAAAPAPEVVPEPVVATAIAENKDEALDGA